MPEISVEGDPTPFVLRSGLTLPPTEAVDWSGQSFTFRWLEGGGELPYPPPPPDPSMPVDFPVEAVYPNIALIGGTDDPRAAYIVHLIRCDGGYDPALSHAIGVPPRYAPTGEWVFEVSGRCDD